MNRVTDAAARCGSPVVPHSRGRRRIGAGTALAVAALAAAVLAGAAARFPSARRYGAPIPAGSAQLGSREPGGRAPYRFETGGFRLGRYPVTTGMYARYLRETDTPPPWPDGIRRGRGGRPRPARGERRRPVAGVTRAEAEAFCRWLSGRWGVEARLPTESEWEYAARGGIDGGRYPWGWGDPEGRAHFDATGRARVGRTPPNGYGLRDMAGQVFEWCAPEPGDEAAGIARGGSWAERDPRFLRVFHRTPFPPDYRGADLGFRVRFTDPPG